MAHLSPKWSPIVLSLLAVWVTLLVVDHFGPNSVDAQMFFSCSPAYCSAYGKCPEFNCRGRNKVVFRNVTQCGCCHRCVVERSEDEECPSSITGNIPSDQCGPHLKCIKPADTKKPATCSKILSKCELERKAIEENPSQAFIHKPMPDCDEFGEYKSKQCKSGTLCQCVDEKGDLIFGSAPEHRSRDMNCLCSRQYLNMNRKLKEYGSQPLNPINFMRCQANGNYEEHQSHNGYDYCVFTSNGTLRDRPVLRKFAKDLICYRQSYQFQTDCVKKYNEAIANITKLEQEGYSVVGFEKPRCDLDGSFHPVQCFNNKCTCVDAKGIPLRDANGVMEVDRNDPYLAANQQCSCARHMEKIRAIPESKRNKVTDLFRRYQCDKNGNYLPIQCSDSACYCVDPISGYATGSESNNENSYVLKSDPDAIMTLFCYKRYHNKAALDRIFHLVQ